MKFWESDPVVSAKPVQPVSQGGGLYRIPDPEGEANTRRADEAADRDAARTGISIRGEGYGRTDAAFQKTDTVINRYRTDDRVVRYRMAIPIFASMLDAPPGGEGDLSLVNAFAKINDPTTGVLQGESNAVGGSQSTLDQMYARLLKEFDSEGGLFTPKGRRDLINAASQRIASYNNAYNLAREDATRFAQSAGIDPAIVIGSHDAAPYRARYDEWRGVKTDKPDGGPFDPGSGRATAITGDLAEDDAGTGYRLPTETEQQFFGFVQSRGPDLTVGDVEQWFVQNVPGATFTPEWRDRMGAYVDAVREGREVAGGLDYSLTDEAEMMRLEQRARDEGLRAPGGGGFGQSLDAFGRGAADVVSLGFADEIAAAGDTVFGGGTMEDNLAYQRYIDRRDSEANPYARLAGQVAGGVAVPLGRLRAAELTPRALAKEGAAFGGGYGVGSAEGDIGDRLVGGATGTVAGGATGYGLGAGLRAVMPKINGALANRAAAKGARNQEAQAFAEAALRNPDVPVMRADVPGATGQQISTALAERTLAGGKVTRARDASAEALGNTANDVASRFGQVASERSIAGEAAQSGARSFVDASQTRVGKMYDAIPIDPASSSSLDGTRAALAELNSRFSSNPQIAAALKDNRLATYERALSEGGLSWQDLKEFRSTVGEIIDGPVLSEGTSRKAMRRLYGALSDDMEATAAAQGPKALAAFKRANAAAKQRFDTIDSVITPILGNDGSKSATAAFERIQSWAQEKGGDPVRLARLIRSMPPDDAGVVRATIIASLGKATPGAQNAAADLFSPNTFVTNWAKLGDRAKGILFDGEHRQALDDIATLASGMKEGRRFTNTSETTRGTMALATVGSIGTAIGAGNPLGLLLSIGGAGGQVMLSRVMANPRSAKWLAALAKKPNPQAQRAHIQRLDAIARSEPLIANDILGLQQRLLEAFGTQPTRLAAENQGVDERGGVQRKNEGQSDER